MLKKICTVKLTFIISEMLFIKHFKTATSLLCIFTILAIGGCKSDNPTTPPPTSTSDDVSGKVIDAVGNGLTNVAVVIGDQKVTTAPDGSFTIPNVSTPYDLKIISAYGIGIVYKSVTIRNPKVLGIGIPQTPNQCTLNVSIPASKLNPTRKAEIIFTDALAVQADGLIIGSPNNDSSTTFIVKWLGTDQSISGKIIVLIYTTDASGHISSYDLYGDKSCTLTNGSTITVAFGVNELPIPPGQSTISGSIIPPGGYTNVTATLAISFITTNNFVNSNLGINYTGSATILDTKPAPAYTFNVPTNIPINKLVVTGYAETPTDVNFYKTSNKTIVCLAGTPNNNINLEAVPNLITPQNGANTIDTNSSFMYSDPGGGNGLYLISYLRSNPANKIFYVFTTLTNSSIPNLYKYGLSASDPNDNSDYTWFIFKILGITSTDDILSVPIVNNNNYSGFTVSEQRNFSVPHPPVDQNNPKQNSNK